MEIQLINDFMEKEIAENELSWIWIMEVIDKIDDTDLSEFMYKWDLGGKTQYNFNYIDFSIGSDMVSSYVELDLDPGILIHSIRLFQPNINKIYAVYECIIETIKYINKVRS